MLSAEWPIKREKGLRVRTGCTYFAAHPACLPGSRWKASAAQRVSLGGLGRARVGEPRSKTVIDKVLGQRSAVSRFCPQVSSAPAGHLHLCWNRRAVQRARVHGTAEPVVETSSKPRCLKRDWLLCQPVAASFWRKRGVGKSQGVSAVQELRVHVVGSGVRRITSRCSGPGRIKCSAAGGRALSFLRALRARVLQRPWPAAELNR